MFGWVSVASSVESVQPCVYMDSALLTIKHCFVLLLMKVSKLHREAAGNLKKIVKNSQNMGEILQVMSWSIDWPQTCEASSSSSPPLVSHSARFFVPLPSLPKVRQPSVCTCVVWQEWSVWPHTNQSTGFTAWPLTTGGRRDRRTIEAILRGQMRRLLENIFFPVNKIQILL